MGLKFRNSILNILCKTAMNYFVILFEPFGVKKSIRSIWCELSLLTKIIYFNFIKELKLCTKLVQETVH